MTFDGRKKRAKLTDDEVALRKKCIEDGLTSGEIAKICNCSVKAIRVWAKRNGYTTILRKNGYSKEELIKIKSMLEQGISYRDIAEEMNFTSKTIVYRLKCDLLNGKYKDIGVTLSI